MMKRNLTVGVKNADEDEDETTFHCFNDTQHKLIMSIIFIPYMSFSF